MFSNIYISDWKVDNDKETPFLRVYFSLKDDFFKYVLYIDKSTMQTRDVWRYIEYDVPSFCKYCEAYHMEICPSLNKKEFIDKVISASIF